MKKIAFFVSDISFGGGMERVASWLANVLSEKYDVTIISSFYSGKPFYHLNPQITVKQLVGERMRLRQSFFKMLTVGWKAFNNYSYDLVFTFGEIDSLFVYLYRIFKKIKIVHCSHNTIYPLKTGIEIGQLTLFARFVAENLITIFAEKIIVLNKKEKKFWTMKNFGSSENVDVIYNAIDTKLYEEKCEYNAVTKTFVSVSRINFYQKGVQHIIPIAKIVFSRHPDWKWVWYGSGDKEDVQYLQQQITEAKLSENIILAGDCKKIYKEYSKYAFLVLVSYFEGFGLCLLEAKAKKLPLISFDVNSGPSDIIQDNVNGYLVKPFDVNEMADKICYLIENPDVRMKMSNNTNIGMGEFAADVIAKKWLNLVVSLLCESHVESVKK